MAQISNEILFDTRLVERNIRLGLTTRQDYERYRSELADRAADADPINLDELAELTASRHATTGS